MESRSSAESRRAARGDGAPRTRKSRAGKAPEAKAEAAPVGLVSPFGAPKRLPDGGTRTTLVQRVHQTLLDGLDEGHLRPGQRIKAAELAKRLGLSRAPVREALHILAGQGLVELLPDKGAVMRKLTREDLIQIYEVSGAVVSVGVAGATRRIHEGDNAARVRQAADRIKASAHEPPNFKFYLVLNDFHYLLNEIAEKPYVDFLMGLLNIEYWNRFLAGAIDLRQHIPGYISNYCRLADAVIAGDVRAAEAIMASHIEWSIGLLRADQSS